MKHTKLSSTFLFVAMLSVAADAAPALESAESIIETARLEVRYSSLQTLNRYHDGVGVTALYDQDEFGNPVIHDDSNRKNPLKAGLLSFLVPGLGQYYNGSHVGKIAGFAALEGFLWVKFAQYNSDANDQVIAFQDYADTTWSEAEYFRYLDLVYGVTIDTGAGFTHHLPDTKTQQYYEMIGKYDQFSYGWAPSEGVVDSPWTTADKYSTSPFPSDNRIFYNGMRGRANDLFADRDRMLVFTMLNHLAAGIDAALGALRHNRGLETEDDGFSISPAVTPARDFVSTPRLGVRITF